MDAARVGDQHTCPLSDGPKPHQGGTIQSGVGNVLIGGKKAATAGALCRCLSPAPNMIATGCLTVLISSMPAARKGDVTAHGGAIQEGERSVQIG